MSDLFWSALALMLVFEGLLPFINPGLWREILTRAAHMPETNIRWMGLASMVIGLVLLLLLH